MSHAAQGMFGALRQSADHEDPLRPPEGGRGPLFRFVWGGQAATPTRFSFTGRWTSAENAPTPTPIHHTAV